MTFDESGGINEQRKFSSQDLRNERDTQLENSEDKFRAFVEENTSVFESITSQFDQLLEETNGANKEEMGDAIVRDIESLMDQFTDKLNPHNVKRGLWYQNAADEALRLIKKQFPFIGSNRINFDNSSYDKLFITDWVRINNEQELQIEELIKDNHIQVSGLKNLAELVKGKRELYKKKKLSEKEYNSFEYSLDEQMKAFIKIITEAVFQVDPSESHMIRSNKEAEVAKAIEKYFSFLSISAEVLPASEDRKTPFYYIRVRVSD